MAKRKDSFYEPGKRTGSWTKLRINRGQEIVIGGFTPGMHGLDSVIVGYFQGKDLVYVARTRNGFVPATRRSVYEKLKPLITDKCPFVNLPETGRAGWDEILDAEKMKKCIWVRPKLVAVIEFLEWTEGDKLRHSKFIALRDDKAARSVDQRARRQELTTLCASPCIGAVRTRLYRASNLIPLLLGMAIGLAISQDGQGGFMKKFLAVSALVLSSSCLASAQSTEPQTRDNTATRYDEPRHNWSWIGLLGLAGLAGLRRQKSETAQRFESRGVKVNAV